MTKQTWTELPLALPLMTNEVPARPAGLWTPVLDAVAAGGQTLLKIEAVGSWEYLPGTGCGPDGHVAGGTLEGALTNLAPVGALIAKIGGGTAEVPDASKGAVMAVGSFCVIALTADTKGALFMTMNDRVTSFGRHDGALKIRVFTSS
jgi:hypothetical protein